MSKGNIILIAGPSGSGKDSVMSKVFERHKEIEFSISYTTRPMRDGEVQDKKYHHILKEDFDKLLNENEYRKKVEPALGRYNSCYNDCSAAVA